ncbi:hypothetical protein [Pseudomonas sp. Hg5Tf]|uniref:Uncharacterized protein n=1 Tax=Pseudomonas sp. Hg7Tf TaxID=3236988 RepID=A0AB39HQK9_9PSED|nr:hypothetical protein [Pseudomonas sp. Hg5Tf]MDH2559038.1 hypothetical protein [Pseudomonas sp. Hg5Tf]
MSKRKPNNMRARMERSLRAILSTNHVAVVCIETTERQGLINWKSCVSIAPSQQVASAVCDIAHRWTIFIGVMCEQPNGEQYLKSEEFAPQGNYLSRHLSELIEATHAVVLSTANPNHVVSSGWLAIPYDVTISEAQAAKVFAAVGGWIKQKAYETQTNGPAAPPAPGTGSLAA